MLIKRWLLVGAWLCMPPVIGWSDDTEYFPDVSQLETTLHRGVSTKADVLALLGEPSGPGTYHLPFDFRATGQTNTYTAGDILFYQDIAVGDVDRIGEVIEIEISQSILLVFIKNGYFDGFMWYSNEGVAEGR